MDRKDAILLTFHAFLLHLYYHFQFARSQWNDTLNQTSCSRRLLYLYLALSEVSCFLFLRKFTSALSFHRCWRPLFVLVPWTASTPQKCIKCGNFCDWGENKNFAFDLLRLTTPCMFSKVKSVEGREFIGGQWDPWFERCVGRWAFVIRKKTVNQTSPECRVSGVIPALLPTSHAIRQVGTLTEMSWARFLWAHSSHLTNLTYLDFLLLSNTLQQKPADHAEKWHPSSLQF